MIASLAAFSDSCRCSVVTGHRKAWCALKPWIHDTIRQQNPSCFPISMSHCLVFARITVCRTNLWTKWGNGSILRNTLPKWGGVVFCLLLTESDPAFWNWINISKLIHSVAPQIVVLKNQRGQWAKRVGWEWIAEAGWTRYAWNLYLCQTYFIMKPTA